MTNSFKTQEAIFFISFAGEIRNRVTDNEMYVVLGLFVLTRIQQPITGLLYIIKASCKN